MAAEAVLAAGGSIGMRVETSVDGRVIVTATRTPAPHATIQAAPNACQDRAHHLTTSFWHTTVNWSFQAVSKPSNLTQGQAAAGVKAGAAHITRASNNCGRADKVGATSSYNGVTSVRPNIGNSICRSPDGRNVVGFGDLLGSQLGLTCWWFRGSTTVEADTKLNKHDFSWTNTTAGCANQYVLQAVATHEFGHVFGLAHVSEATHPDLTMSTAIVACDNSASTLGLGDMLGLEARY